jgi:hypothetical protein
VRTLKVLINDPEVKGKRKEVEVVKVSESDTTVRVRLPDGNVIRRKKSRDMVNEKENKG